MRRLARSRLSAAVLGAALALTAAACDDNGDEESLGPDEGVDVEDVAQAGTIADDEFGIYDEDELGDLDDPSLVGRTVVVSGQINRMIEEDAAFLIGEDVVDGGLLVVTPPRLQDEPVLAEGVVVQVVGRVVEFNVVDIESDYDPFDLDDELYADWEDRIVLVAQAVSFAPHEGAGQGAQGATLRPLNDSGAAGTAAVEEDNGSIEVTLTARGVSAGVPHAQHIHIGGQGTCPGAETDAGTDELIDTVEGQAAYGPIKVSLTTEGDVTPASALATDRFPTADAGGTYTYTRSLSLPEGVTFADVQQGVVVVHGNTALFGDDATYDGSKNSPLDQSLPLEATIPVLCGQL